MPAIPPNILLLAVAYSHECHVNMFQRALMQFSEMQVIQDVGKETKRTQKAQPPPPSQARQKAMLLKKKAMQGSTKSG